MNVGDHKLYDTWNQVPVTYYQNGTKNNLFQKIWHYLKIGLAKKIIGEYGGVKNCLDIGCNSGYMINEISKSFPKVKYYGVDIFDKAIEYAKSRYPHIEFKVASADKLPFKDNSFDLVLFYETIEHVEDPLTSLKEVKRVLNKNGVAIVTMDSGSFLFRLIWYFWENTTGRAWKGAHLHPFHHSELQAIIVKSGLKIQKKIFSHLGMEVTFILYK